MVRWFFIALLSNVLCCWWMTELAATGPMRWEACLPWMSHDHVSPVWGCSVCSQIIGKLGHCSIALLNTGQLHTMHKTVCLTNICPKFSLHDKRQTFNCLQLQKKDSQVIVSQLTILNWVFKFSKQTPGWCLSMTTDKELLQNGQFLIPNWHSSSVGNGHGDLFLPTQCNDGFMLQQRSLPGRVLVWMSTGFSLPSMWKNWI